MRTHGKIDHNTLSSLEQSLQPYPLRYPPLLPSEVVDPIMYLHDPAPGYMICQTCFEGFLKPPTNVPSKSMREHPCFNDCT